MPKTYLNVIQPLNISNVQMRNYGKEHNKCKPKKNKRKENGVGLVVDSVNHKVQ
jgi:hypothetical protein